LEIKPGEFDAAIARMKDLPFAGWNCTLPHKKALANHMDRLDPSAQVLGGVVNTVMREKDGSWTGHNTDGEGWMRAVSGAFGIEPVAQRILILGAGGAGQGLARQASYSACRKVRIANRSFEKARQVAETRLPGGTPLEVVPWQEKDLREALQDTDLVVNTTSLGLKPEDPPVLDRALLHPALKVYDTIYTPAETGLLREAKAVGARTSNGLGMLLHQGALSFKIWTGQNAPLDVMQEALETAAGQPI
jgi:shikimate dehydrogenase